jgi:hypothetical protein
MAEMTVRDSRTVTTNQTVTADPTVPKQEGLERLSHGFAAKKQQQERKAYKVLE